MLTNLLFVFGLSCLIGGIKYQTQSLRIVSGNASIGMLMLAVAGLALPAALILSDEMVTGDKQRQYVDKNGDGVSDIVDGPTESMLGFSRFNAVIMVCGYVMYLLFQLGTHGEEFEDVDEEEGAVEIVNERGAAGHSSARRNKFCARLFGIATDEEYNAPSEIYHRVAPCMVDEPIEIEMQQQSNGRSSLRTNGSHRKFYSDSDIDHTPFDDTTVHSSNVSRKRSINIDPLDTLHRSRPQDAPSTSLKRNSTLSSKSHCSDGSVEEDTTSPSRMIPILEVHEQVDDGKPFIMLSDHIKKTMHSFAFFSNPKFM
jgi:Ca2+/H+ antiporter